MAEHLWLLRYLDIISLRKKAIEMAEEMDAMAETIRILSERKAIADSPPDGRTIIDPPTDPKMNPGKYGTSTGRIDTSKPNITKGLCGWDDQGTPCE